MSGQIRFISDPHFKHEAIAKKRGFPNSECHDENFITQWNLVVDKKDTTWILGDITMEKNDYEILNRLNGYKRVILGNHDMGNHSKHLQKYVNSIHGMSKLRTSRYGNIFLTHCPIHPQELEYRVNFNMHGHTHENIIKDDRYICVCAEVLDYIPKTLDELMKERRNGITKEED